MNRKIRKIFKEGVKGSQRESKSLQSQPDGQGRMTQSAKHAGLATRSIFSDPKRSIQGHIKHKHPQNFLSFCTKIQTKPNKKTVFSLKKGRTSVECSQANPETALLPRFWRWRHLTSTVLRRRSATPIPKKPHFFSKFEALYSLYSNPKMAFLKSKPEGLDL